MINPATLRTGNVIKVKDQGKWKTAVVSATFPTWIIARNKYAKVGGCYDPNELHGAFLSDDWLVENGWKPSPSQSTETSETFVLCFTNENTSGVSLEMTGYMFQLKMNGTPILGQFNTMHELQNRFQLATGQELLSNSSLKALLALAAPITSATNDDE